ncbi:hypothetical protein ADIS_1707 [Lunatimonas lonarensis]|uniref:Uncharacterized protein n=1 Tax=Lunatimonas lonarensis TaxID=1232681 RepID=R7ZUT3_9BACT|nr:hypothetical protein ADIS_1707 [Lunatimonas lonarensis]
MYVAHLNSKFVGFYKNRGKHPKEKLIQKKIKASLGEACLQFIDSR